MNITINPEGEYVFTDGNWSTKSKNLDNLRAAVARAYTGSPRRSAALKVVDDYRKK